MLTRLPGSRVRFGSCLAVGSGAIVVVGVALPHPEAINTGIHRIAVAERFGLARHLEPGWPSHSRRDLLLSEVLIILILELVFVILKRPYLEVAEVLGARLVEL